MLANQDVGNILFHLIRLTLSYQAGLIMSTACMASYISTRVK